MKQNYLLVSKQIDFELLITYLKISVKIFKPNKSALYMLKPFVMHTLGFAKTRNAWPFDLWVTNFVSSSLLNPHLKRKNKKQTKSYQPIKKANLKNVHTTRPFTDWQSPKIDVTLGNQVVTIIISYDHIMSIYKSKPKTIWEKWKGNTESWTSFRANN